MAEFAAIPADAAERRIGPDQGCWRRHAGDGPQMLLAYWGEMPPFELQIAAQVLQEGERRGADGCYAWQWFRMDGGAVAPARSMWFVAQLPPGREALACAERLLSTATVGVFIGPAAAWFAQLPIARHQRASVHWEDAAAREHLVDHVVLSPSIIEVCGRWTTCSGGFAVTDLALLMLRDLAGSAVALRVMDALCIDRLREPPALQRKATAGALAVMAPKLAEAVALMEANVEEPLPTDEIARLIGISRRQLERLFKQHFGTVPSRYYLDVRLQRARKLIRETRHSVLQVALMCGFASGSHFSTTYGSVFGITPRDERQKALG